MKKLFKLCTLVLIAMLCVVSLSACKKKKDNGISEADFLQTFSIDQEGKLVSQDFVLEAKKTIEQNGKTYEFILEWSSDNSTALSVEKRENDYLAKVGFPDQDATVTLTVKVGKAEKTFTVRVNALDVYAFSQAYSFPNQKQVVVESFTLDTEVELKAAGKKATITWSVDDDYKDYIKIEGNQCVVTPSTLNPEVKIKATFTYGSETTTKTYTFTVSKTMTDEERVDYWYANGGISQTISGYVVAKGNWKEYNGVYEAIICVLDDSGLCGYYLYLEPTELNKEAFQALEIGAHVTNEGSVNAIYHGLHETSSYKGKTVVDKDIAVKAITPFAIDNDVLAGSAVSTYMQSTLVSLTNWEVKEVKEWSVASGSNTVLVVTKGGVDVAVITSKYFLLEPDSLGSDQTLMPQIQASVANIKAGDFVNIKGILSNYDGVQIVAISADAITKGEADTADQTKLPGVLVKAAIAQNKALVPSGLVTVEQTINFFDKDTENNLSAKYEILGKSNSVTVEGNKVSVKPGSAEITTIKVTYTCGNFSTWELIRIKSQAVTDAEMVAAEKEALTEFGAEKTMDLQLKGKTYESVSISWALKEASEGVEIKDGKLILAGGLEKNVTLIATLTCGNESDTVEVTAKIKTPKIEETGTWTDPLSPATAIILAGQLDGANKEISAEKYYVKGTIATDPTADYCNFDFIEGSTHLVVYGLWAVDGNRYGSSREIAEIPVKNGDVVVLYGNLQNYQGKLEVVNATLVAIGETVFMEEDKQVISPATAIILASRLDAATNEKSEHTYYVKGTIATDPTADYCNFDFIEGETHLVVYGLWSVNDKRFGSARDIAEIPVKKDDVVVLKAKLQNYGGKLELINAVLVELNGEKQVKEGETPVGPQHAGTLEDPYDIADAILAAKNGETKEVYISGVANSSKFETGKNYTIWLQNGTTKNAFELYHVTLAEGVVGDTNPDALVGYTVVCKGVLTIYNNTTYEISEGVIVSLTASETPVEIPKFVIDENNKIDFTLVGDFADWPASYSYHKSESGDLTLEFSNAAHQVQTITDIPAAASKDAAVYVTITSKEANMTGATFELREWSSSKVFVTITIEYKNATGEWTATEVGFKDLETAVALSASTITDNKVSASGLPATSAIRLVIKSNNSGTNQQIGLVSATLAFGSGEEELGEAETSTDVLYVSAACAELEEGAKVKIEDKVLLVGTNAFATIDAAVAKVAEGKTIKLVAGEYTGATLNVANITLEGPNAGQSPVVGPRAAEAIFKGDIVVAANGITIKGIELTEKGRIKVDQIDGITMENIYVYGSLLNKGATADAGGVSTDAAFYITASKNIVLKNSMIANDASVEWDRPMIMYGYDIENLTVTGNSFTGRYINYNDGIKIDNAGTFGIKGNVTISDNSFKDYQQYVIWFKQFGAGTYVIQNNSFEHIGSTDNHGMVSFITYKGTAEEQVKVTFNYNQINNSKMLMRIDNNADLSTNATVNANYNVYTANANPANFLNNKDADVSVNADYNYWDGPVNTGKIQNATSDHAYTDALDVPAIGDADETNNTYTITFDLNGGEWFEENSLTYVYGHGATLETPEKAGFTFYAWEDADGQLYTSIPASLHQDLALKAIWK